MSATKKFLVTAIIATSLIGGVSSASAVDTKDAAVADETPPISEVAINAVARNFLVADISNSFIAHRVACL